MRNRSPLVWFAAIAAIAAALFAQTQTPPQKSGDLGFTDTSMLPAMPWHVHDPSRQHPKVVTPGGMPGAPPSDAIVLFDGEDLSKWCQAGKGADEGRARRPEMAGAHRLLRSGADTGDLRTRESFGDIQLHVEWSEPPDVAGTSQGRGTSGVFPMSLNEIQVLDPTTILRMPMGRPTRSTANGGR
jgi:hypothetical protein